MKVGAQVTNKRHSGLRATSIFAAFIVAALLPACVDELSDKEIQQYRAIESQGKANFDEVNRRYDAELAEAVRVEAEAEAARLEVLKEKAQEEDDDKKCQSFGAKLGTQPYIQCRVSLIQLHDLQKQRAEEESQRNADAESYEVQRRDENAALQQARADDERRRADEARRQRSLGLLQLGTGLLQSSQMPAPPVTPSQRSYTINGKIHNCSTVGNNTTCY